MPDTPKPAHTPGPWLVEGCKPMEITGRVHRVVDGGRFPTAFVPAWDQPKPGEIDGTDQAIANAALIAAAPDMLAALKRVVSFPDRVVRTWDEREEQKAAINAALAAIAKAEGK